LFDPLPVLDLIPDLIFVDLEDNPFRVRFRHTGTKYEEIACVDITNRYMDEFGGDDTQAAIDMLSEHYRGCRQSGQPSFGTFQWPNDRGEMVTVDFAIFPFAVHGIVRECIAIEDYGLSRSEMELHNLRLPPGSPRKAAQ
jgi:hypothetical protein